MVRISKNIKNHKKNNRRKRVSKFTNVKSKKHILRGGSSAIVPDTSAINAAWQQLEALDGRVFYMNTLTGVRQWEFPREAKAAMEAKAAADAEAAAEAKNEIKSGTFGIYSDDKKQLYIYWEGSVIYISYIDKYNVTHNVYEIPDNNSTPFRVVCYDDKYRFKKDVTEEDVTVTNTQHFVHELHYTFQELFYLILKTFVTAIYTHEYNFDIGKKYACYNLLYTSLKKCEYLEDNKKIISAVYSILCNVQILHSQKYSKLYFCQDYSNVPINQLWGKGYTRERRETLIDQQKIENNSKNIDNWLLIDDIAEVLEKKITRESWQSARKEALIALKEMLDNELVVLNNFLTESCESADISQFKKTFKYVIDYLKIVDEIHDMKIQASVFENYKVEFKYDTFIKLLEKYEKGIPAPIVDQIIRFN